MLSSPSVISCLIQFDHNIGPAVQYHYPEHVPAQVLALLPIYALPDAIHQQNLDFTYFTTHLPEPSDERLSGISCFKQSLATDTDRGCHQRAIVLAILQKLDDEFNYSLYSTLQFVLSRPARHFFERSSQSQNPLDLLKALHNDAEMALNSSVPSNHCSNTVFISSLKKLIAFAPQQVLTVIKAINAGAKVVIFSRSSLHHLTSTVLAFACLAAGPIEVFPYVPIQDFEACLERAKHLLLGTNHQIIWARSSANLLFNLESYELRTEQGVWTEILRLTRADRRFSVKIAENPESIVTLYKDYQDRAISSLNLGLQSDPKHELSETIDDVVRDFNTSWAGIMFGFTKTNTQASEAEQCEQNQDYCHPCHDDNDGDDVFDEDASLGSIWNSISAQTLSLGDQAKRSLLETSSRVSSWIGSLTQSISLNDQDSEPTSAHSIWTD